VDGGYLAMGPESIGKTTFNAGSAWRSLPPIHISK